MTIMAAILELHRIAFYCDISNPAFFYMTIT